MHPSISLKDKKYIPFNDLQRHYDSLKSELDNAVDRILKSGWYILGPEVEAFEIEFANYCGTSHCIGVANGTDALEIGLKSLGISQGDEVITVANAGMYSTTAIRALGAIPVFADIDPITMIMDSNSMRSVVSPKTQAVIITHLYGRMAHMPEIRKFTKQKCLALIEDCAQAHGAQVDGRTAGSWGDIACYSFYPTKNLGALGDGGAIVTSDDQLAYRARRLRQYGWDKKYESTVAGGRNSRLDEIQAAILRVKLPYLDKWNEARVRIAKQYNVRLVSSSLQLPAKSNPGEMVYHLYVLRTKGRDRLRKALTNRGIGCDVHYPIPDHLQEACADLQYSVGMLPETERAAAEVLTLPCFPELSPSEVEQVIANLMECLDD